MSTCAATGCKGRVKPPESHCNKCKQRRHDASDRTECKTIMNVEDAWINEFVVVNEVLWYADQHRHTATKDGIVRVLSCSFEVQELEEAKGLLVAKHGEFIDNELKKSRKDSANRSEKMKICEDILDMLHQLDMKIDLICLARNWKKVIKTHPEEMMEASVVEKVDEHSKQISKSDNVMSQIKADMAMLKEKLDAVLDLNRTGGQESQVSAVQNTNKQGAPYANALKKDVRPTTASNVPQESNRRQTSGQQMMPSRDRGRRPVVGRSGGDGLRVTPIPTWHYFVYKVHKEDEEDELREYITKHNVTVRNLQKCSHNDAAFNSFKLSVSRNDADIILNEDFWPEGIRIRRWFDRQKQGSTSVNGKNNEEDDKAAESSDDS